MWSMPVKPKNPVFQTLASLALALAWSPAGAVTVQPPGPVHDVKLIWNADTEADIEGYTVHVGTQPGEYIEVIEVGPEPELTLPSMPLGETFYFAVRAIGSNGLESELSTELAVTIVPPPLPVTSGMVTTAPGALGLQWIYPKSHLGSSPEFEIQSSQDLVTWTTAATVQASQAVNHDTQNVRFTWSVNRTAPRLFYRLSARNFVGPALAP
jgi:hypothetical protein